MKKFLYFACLLGMIVSFASCEKKREPELCSLYGVVTDKATGEPIRTAGVELLPVGKKSVTGSDGAFEFLELEEGIYKLYITKTGYKDTTSNEIAVKANSEKVSHSIQLEKLPPALTIVDDNQNEIDSIDFGSDEGTKMRSFNIFNNSEDKLEWQLVYQCAWIDTITKTSGELKANATQSIVITIDRLKLNVGDNSTVIQIVSNNGSKQLTITAKSVNIIETLEASDVGGVRAVLNARVVRDLNPSITEYGFVYNTTPAPKLTNTSKKVSQSGTPKIGLYNMLIEGLENYTKYFACAFVLNTYDTIYGEQIDFETVSHIPSITNFKKTQEQAKSFTIEYNVTDGGLALDEVGVCWSTTPVPTIEDNYKKTGSDAKNYTTKISGLDLNTTYYVRVFARNSESEIYSEQIHVTTLDGYPKVTTDSVVTDLGSVKATCGGNVTDNGTLTVTERGICYGIEQQPDIYGTHTTEGTGIGKFTSKLKNLKDNTTYYFRAYATTEAGTAYGKQYSFLTHDGTPTVELIAIKDTTANSVTCEGNVTGDGGVTVTERGFCYSTSQYPTNTSEHIVVGNNTGKFTGSLTGLVPNTTYYVRAYAVNSLGIGYSEQQPFTTKDGLPKVCTGQPSSTATTISASGEITDNGGFAVTERGICYSASNAEPTTIDEKVIGGKGNGVFNVSITNLTAATTYYVRAYAMNENGTSYGDPVTICTKDGKATVSTGEITNITALTASGNVTVTDAGGATLQQCGICWSINQNPTIADSSIVAGGKQLNTPYTCNLSGLQPNTTYYVRAYATTDVATAYSEQVSFKTTTGLPEITTGQATPTASSITISGEVTGNGGYAVTERGVCYSAINAEPTLSDSKVQSGSGNGSFSASITNLDAATTYYIRAYATNSIGTAYGKAISVTTKDGGAIVKTGSISNVTALTATGSVKVNDASGASLQSCGICWSINPNPTIDDNKTVASGKQVGVSYACNMSALTPNTKYYVRGFATTDVTTSYGDTVSFSTNTGLPVVETGTYTTTASSFTINSEVTENGGYAVTERGICYSRTNAEPTLSDTKVSSGSGNGKFNTSVSQLTAATTYYVRAYAINSIGTTFGGVLTVITKDGRASVTISETKNVTALTASCDVSITDNGGATLQSCGICWSTNPTPTIDDYKTEASGTQTNTAYTCNLSALTPKTQYYVRGYAITDVTTVYSGEKSFTTKDGLPELTTSTTTATSTSIYSGGNITKDGGYAITERGVCYSAVNASPTLSDNFVTNGSGKGSYTCTITNVSVNTTYYVCAYATNSIGTKYGDVQTVTTGNGLPIVKTTTIGENVTETTAIGGGEVVDDGGYTVTSRGVCWSTLPNPTTADNKTTDGSGRGYFTSNITGIDLTGSNVYYVRAYATNANGTSYGSAVTFSKENLDYANLPTIQYGGYLYKLYPNMGTMSWDAAMTACQNLSYGGYDDWFLPSRDEIRACYNATYAMPGWTLTEAEPYTNYVEYKGRYWTSDEYDSYSSYIAWAFIIIVQKYTNGTSIPSSSTATAGKNTNSYQVRAVRKYLANQ